MHEDAAPPRPVSGLRKDVLLALGILLLAGPLMQEWFAQTAPRYTLTVAIVEDGSLELDPYQATLGLDQARYRGHTYSDKAPYQPLLAAPLLGVYLAAGGDAFPIPVGEEGAFMELHDVNHRGLWWVTLWSSTVPAMVLAIIIRRTVATVYPRQATVVAIALMVGTLLLPFASLLFGHVMAAMWVAAAWALLRGSELSARAAVGAGLCLGAAIGTEYTLALVALLALIAAWAMFGFVRACWLSVGTVVATLPLLLYNWLVFEDPFEVSYQGHLPNFQGKGALGVYNLTPPKLDEIYRALASSKGLFVLTPVMIFAFVGCWFAIRGATAARRDSVFALGCFSVMLAATTGIDGLGGASPGPRYLIPIVPLFALPLAEAWRRLPLVCAISTAIGAAWMLLASATLPLAPFVESWVDAAMAGHFAANVVTGHSHTWVLVLPTVAGLVVLARLLKIDPDRVSPPAEA